MQFKLQWFSKNKKIFTSRILKKNRGHQKSILLFGCPLKRESQAEYNKKNPNVPDLKLIDPYFSFYQRNHYIY